MYRCSISKRFTFLHPCLRPSIFHVCIREDDQEGPARLAESFVIRTNAFHAQKSCTNPLIFDFGAFYPHNGSNIKPRHVTDVGSSFRGFSSAVIEERSDDIDFSADGSEAFSSCSAEDAVTHSPVLDEVAVAAADSAIPVAALQYLIDGVHSFTGTNWWASIMITTILIRTATVPLLINVVKATTKLTQIRPQIEEIRQEMLDSMDPKSVTEGQKKMKLLLKKHNVSPFSPMKGLLIQGPVFVSFFLAINNMVEKVPSFKTGGVYWFTDLTTVDSLYIFPALTGLSFWITVELNAQEGMEGNPIAGTVKNFSRILAVLAVPFTMNFPKALFCYWITSNLFSLCYGLVMKRSAVKRLLGIPEIVVPPTNVSQQNIPFFRGPNSVIGRAKALLEQSKPAAASSQVPNIVQESKLPDRKARSSSSFADVSRRLQNLERKVKGRKKHKR